MDPNIQGALSILSTVSGPSPILDGLVDQIVSTGLPMVPTLVSAAAASSGGATSATTSADTTARMLLNGMQRAAEHVSAERKVSIVKGIAKHVCPSPVLPWAVRAFAVKVLQAIFQNTLSSVPAEVKTEAVAAAAEAVILIIHTAHIVELAKHLKVTTEASEALVNAPHPYHNAEIKSASEFFALLAEMDADAVASVYSQKQKNHSAAVAEIVASASADNTAASSVAQAILSRYDLITLGLPRTVPLRVALEKLNCSVLLDLGKSLSELGSQEAFDHVMTAYPLFFGRNQHHPHKKAAPEKNNNSINNQNEHTDAPTPSTECNGPAKEEGATKNAAEVFAESILKLTVEQSVSKETICMFLKERLKDSIARLSVDLVDSPADPSAASAWSARLATLSKANLFARPNVLLAPALADLVYGIFHVVARNAGSSEEADAVLSLARSLERYIHRSVAQVAVTSNTGRHNKSEPFDPSTIATSSTPIHSRFVEGLTVLLKALLPSSPLATEAEADLSLNAPLLEVAAMLVSYLSPKPIQYEATLTDACPKTENKRGKRQREDDQNDAVADEHSENEVDDEDGDASEHGEDEGPKPADRNQPRAESKFHYFNEAQSFYAAVMRGGQATALQSALRTVNDEINTVEVSKRLEKLLGSKAPAEVREALSDNSNFLTSAALYYRQRVLQNILAIFRLQCGARNVSVGIASYSPAALKKERDEEAGENDEPNQHRHHRNSSNNNNNGNVRAGGSRSTNGAPRDVNDHKRHRHEDSKQTGGRGHNTSHHGNARGGGSYSNSNDRRGARDYNTSSGKRDDRDRRDYRDNRRDNHSRR